MKLPNSGETMEWFCFTALPLLAPVSICHLEIFRQGDWYAPEVEAESRSSSEICEGVWPLQPGSEAAEVIHPHMYKTQTVQNTVSGLIFYRFFLTEKGTGIFEPSPLIESDVEFQSIFWTSKSEGRGNMFVKVNHTPTHTQTKKDDK